LADRVAQDGVRAVLACFADLAGRMRAKLVPRESLTRLTGPGLRFSGFAAGMFGRTATEGDLTIRPDVSTYLYVPFLAPDLAMVQCDVFLDDEPWPFSSRGILAGMLAELAGRGLHLRIGAEIEYFLVERDTDGRLRVADRRDTATQSCYDARGLIRYHDHLSEVTAAVNQLGWSAYGSEHEDANGQYEQNFEHAEALVTADRVVAFRHLLGALAERRGLTATFMPKPFGDQSGSGLHLNLSLWRDGRSLFGDPDDPRGLGLSTVGYAALAGLMEHSPALMALAAPTVNSYKRFAHDPRTGGMSWVPVRASYGGDDRHQMFRVPDGHRIEYRASDSAANPYLALATVTAAMLDGLDRDLDPGQPGEPGPFLPPTLIHAVEAMMVDRTVAAALDIAAPTQGLVSGYFARTKRQEFLDWHLRVSDVEVDWYLSTW
jgi:glutamine synthetase